MQTGFATEQGTRRFAERLEFAAKNHFRSAQTLLLSSIGIGTYLGNWDDETDDNYSCAVECFVKSGGNVIDTAANYRFQRSERNIGKAVRKLVSEDYSRDEIFICTKGGYLPFDNEPPQNVRAYFEENFVETKIASFDDLVGGSHCMTPKYLANQIEQSLANMDLSCLDVFYIHNPEAQAAALDPATFEARLADAFEMLEQLRSDEKIRFYGAATWNGFRVAPESPSYHSLEKMVNIARQIGGANHGFKFIQLPFNLAMPEALLYQNQAFGGEVFSTLEAARKLDVSAVASASIMQGKLASNLPENLRAVLGNPNTDAQAAIQFARSAPNVVTALVGMSREEHVEENMELLEISPIGESDFQKLFASAE